MPRRACQDQGFFFPTGPVKPPPSGSGLPDRFDRKPLEIGGIQNPGCNLGSRYRPVRPNRRGPVPVYRTGLAGNRSKSNLNLKFSVQTVCIGIPAG